MPLREPSETVTRKTNLSVSRRQLLQGGAGLALAAVAGCSSSSTSAPSKSGGKTTLRLMSWEQYLPAEKAAWFKVVDEFKAAHPNIDVTWTGFQADTYTANVITQVQAGKIDADVIMCTPELATTLILKYNLGVPLQSITHSLGLDPISAHSSFAAHGNLYGLGVIDVSFALVYDERILSQAGISHPPENLDEWLANTKTLTHRPQQFGTALFSTVASGLNWFNQLQNFPLAYGGVWAKGKTLMLESEPVIKGMQYWLDLLKASGLAGTSEAALLRLIYSDRTPLWPQVAAGMGTLKSLAPKFYPNMRSAPFPFPGHKAAARLHPLVVLKTSPNVDAAMELVKWIVTPKNLFYVNTTNGYPIIPYSNFAHFEPGYEPFLKAQPWASGFLEGDYVGEGELFGDYVFAFAELSNIIMTNMSTAISGSTTVAQSMKTAQAQAQAQLGHLL
jgi:ABC-type glycerol-3-phosphate transport system substrate-binding protein